MTFERGKPFCFLFYAFGFGKAVETLLEVLELRVYLLEDGRMVFSMIFAFFLISWFYSIEVVYWDIRNRWKLFGLKHLNWDSLRFYSVLANTMILTLPRWKIRWINFKSTSGSSSFMHLFNQIVICILPFPNLILIT